MIPFLGIYPKEMKTGTDISVSIFIVSLFSITKKVEVTQVTQVHRQMNKQNVICMYTMGYNSSFKRKEILTHAIIWRNLEDVKGSKPVTKDMIYDYTNIK